MNRTVALRVLLPLTEPQLSTISGNASVLFLSGFTAAGKDTVLTLAIEAAQKKGVVIRPIVKLSDRSVRRAEARHFRGISPDEFKSMLQERKILLPFRWFGKHYGFSVADFLTATESPGTVILQMTNLSLVPRAVAAFRAFDIQTVAVFIEAPLYQLVLRTLLRALPFRDTARRLLAAPLEFVESKLRMDFKSDYRHIHNVDGCLVASVDRVLRAVAALQGNFDADKPTPDFPHEQGKPWI